MYGNSQADPYNFAAHEYQQMQQQQQQQQNNHFGEINNDGKVMMSLDAADKQFAQQQKFFAENGTKENHSDFYPHMMADKGGMETAVKSEAAKKRGRKRKNDEDNR